MTGDQAASLVTRMERHEIAAGTALFRYGETADRVYYLQSGTLTASLDVDGVRLEIGVVPPGHWLGEINLIDEGPASADVIANDEAVLYSLRHDALVSLRDDDPEIAAILLRNLTRDLAARLRRTSAGLVERVNDHQFRLATGEVRRGWFSRAIGKLFSGGDR